MYELRDNTAYQCNIVEKQQELKGFSKYNIFCIRVYILKILVNIATSNSVYFVIERLGYILHHFPAEYVRGPAVHTFAVAFEIHRAGDKGQCNKCVNR